MSVISKRSRRILHEAARFEEFAPAPLWNFASIREKPNIAVAQERVYCDGERLVIGVYAANDRKRHVAAEQLIQRF